MSIPVLQASLREEKKLRVENAKLKKEIEGLKQELIQAEIRNGGKKGSCIHMHELLSPSSDCTFDRLFNPS